MGLTDAMPVAQAQAPKETASTGNEEPTARTHTVTGRCFNHADSSPMAGVSVRLYQAEGRSSPPMEIAKTVTDADGRYTFTGLVPPLVPLTSADSPPAAHRQASASTRAFNSI